MKYFEVTEPYYSLIKATSIEDAILLYNGNVAENEDMAEQEIKEVPMDYAIMLYNRGKAEDGKPIPLPELIEDIRSDRNMVLLVDGALS